MKLSFSISPTCQAFNGGMGSQVQNREIFLAAVSSAIETHDTTNDDAPGQHIIQMDPAVIDAAGVTCGVGRRTSSTEAYHLVNWRGQVGAYLKREHAALPGTLKVVVYSREAWKVDPDVIKMGLPPFDEDYSIVAVLADPEGVTSSFSSTRLVANLAGGNKAVKNWTKDDIIQRAKDTKDYELHWSVVCDSDTTI